MSIKLVRFGGLSAVDYKTIYGKDSFHAPPTRYGIYAFLYPYIDDFLWAWKLPETKEDFDPTKERKRFNKHARLLRREFEYNGLIWCHFVEHAKGRKRAGSWVEVTMPEFKKIFRKVMCKDMQRLHNLLPQDNSSIKNAYKRGLGGFISTDHLEVFIDKKSLKGIK